MAPTVLITGASQGSGKATALLFAKSGYDVVMTARQQWWNIKAIRC
jgi:short-subunit dehydrogenase